MRVARVERERDEPLGIHLETRGSPDHWVHIAQLVDPGSAAVTAEPLNFTFPEPLAAAHFLFASVLRAASR